MGVNGLHSSTSFCGGSYNLPPLSLGEMIKTPISWRVASSTDGQLRSLTKYQCRLT